MVASAGSTSAHITCSQGCPQPAEYIKDALVRISALHNEKDELSCPRLTFYLAQSYRGAGEKDKAR